MDNPITNKVRVLKHFGIIDKHDTATITAVKKVLKACRNEYEMDTVLHDVLHGREELKTLLTRKGVM